MRAKLLQANEENQLKLAARMLKEGKIVAFPTETVYGLGANTYDEEAVQNIFLAKGRPQDNPLIVHIHSTEQLKEVVEEVTKQAEILIEHFWPGPLTIILKKTEKIPLVVTANLETVAVRMPENHIAQQVLKFSGIPIVAPSANKSGKPSPTHSNHVIQDLGEDIDAIIEGGYTDIGIESTIIDLTSKVPSILRLGKITREEIRLLIGDVHVTTKAENTPKAPGMKYKHYSPKAKVIIIKDQKEIQQDNTSIILQYDNAEAMAKNLFRDFREADQNNYETIYVKEVPKEGIGKAVMQRLQKASQ